MSGRRPRSSAPRAANGRFHNPWPGAEQHGFGDFLRWRMERWRAGRATAGGAAPLELPRAAPSFAVPRARPEELTATWIGHSTVLVQLGGLNVLTDPMWSRRASPFRWIGPSRLTPPGLPLDHLPPIDLVLLSHDHYDHLDVDSVRALAAAHPGAGWMAPLGLSPLLERLGVRRVTELGWWDEATAGEARVASVPAQHFSARGVHDRGRTLWCGWVVRVGGRALYFAGDTGHHPEFRTIGERFGPFDLSLLPIGAYEPRWFMRPVHVDPEEAVQLFLELNAGAPAGHRAVAMGIHWGTFQLADEPVLEPPARARAAWHAA
ncbi:MAG TPA: MBL fold metallo-hydrolase, partial [Gemmatimonadaceae bacterium]|nr:MBL fold metallo-hydrolase [Gemmatimonadaceae bacterium]